MTRLSKYVAWSTVIILVLLAICVFVTVHTGSESALVIASIGAGLISFALCVVLCQESGIVWISSPDHIRATLAIGIVAEYMVMVGIVAFFTRKNEMPAITQTLIHSFTSIVAVVIAFYFGASAYIQTRRQGTTKTTNTQSERNEV